MDDTSDLTLNDGLFLLVLGGIGMLFPTPGGIGSYHYIVIKYIDNYFISFSIIG